jgi:hypothetical protein
MGNMNVLSRLLRELHTTHGRPILVSGPGREMCQGIPNIRPADVPPPESPEERAKNDPCDAFDKYNSYILWTNDTLSQQLQKLKGYYTAWNPRGRFLIVLEDSRQVLMTLEELRQWNILNVVVLVPASNGENALDLYSWFPFQPPSGKCGKLNEAVLLNKWIGRDAKFLYNISLFPTKFPKDLDGCSILVSTWPLDPHVMVSSDRGIVLDKSNVTYTEGLDIRVLRFLAQSLNATLSFLPPPCGDWGDVYPNETWGGIVGDVLYRRADVGVCGTTYIFAFIPDLEFTVPYDTLDAVWVVPRAKQHPRWGSITRVFHLPMWFLLMFLIIMTAVIMTCLSNYSARYSEEQPVYRSLSGCLSSAWAVMLGVSLAKLPCSGPVRLALCFIVHFKTH